MGIDLRTYVYLDSLQPAAYAFYAANEAEKASHIKIIEVVGYGSFGRVYISGDEAEVLVTKEIVESRLAGVTGRDQHDPCFMMKESLLSVRSSALSRTG